MTDLLALLLGQLSEEEEENRANELNAALQSGTGAPEETGNSSSPAPRLEEAYTALRRAAAGNSKTPQASSLPLPAGEVSGLEQGRLPGQRLVIKEAEPGESLSPTDLDRLFERDARRYDNGFTLY